MNQLTAKQERQSREAALLQKLDRLEVASKNASEVYALATTLESGIKKSLMAAKAMTELRACFDPEIMATVKGVMNSKLGFMTDRPPGAKDKHGNPVPPYPDDVIRDCVIEASLKGCQLVGNQFNIIAFGCYIAQSGWEYKLKNVEGLRWYKPQYGVPKAAGPDGSIVECSCTWDHKGTKGELTESIAVKKDTFTGVDGILGKAKRKFLKRVFETITGVLVSEPEPEETIIENEATQHGPDKARAQESTVPDPAKQEEVDQNHGRGNQSGANSDLFQK